MAKFGRDVIRRFSKIEKRSTGVYLCLFVYICVHKSKHLCVHVYVCVPVCLLNKNRQLLNSLTCFEFDELDMNNMSTYFRPMFNEHWFATPLDGNGAALFNTRQVDLKGAHGQGIRGSLRLFKQTQSIYNCKMDDTCVYVCVCVLICTPARSTSRELMSRVTRTHLRTHTHTHTHTHTYTHTHSTEGTRQ